MNFQSDIFYLLQFCISSSIILEHKNIKWQPTPILFCGTHLIFIYFLLYFFNLHDAKRYTSAEENSSKKY